MINLLRGVRIIDLTTIVLGPYATQFLGDFGADVIKVEAPGGDLFRTVRPGRSAEMGAGFINCNRNKRSIVIDLKRQTGIASLHRLIETADVVVHNMRPASAQKLGIDYDRVKKLNEAIVYCYAVGFGTHGALADTPAYDDTVQAASGLAFLNANADGTPRYLPTVLCDKVGGLHLAIAVLAGLAARDRRGQGACIEVPMFESMISFLMIELLSGETFVPSLGKTGYPRLNSPFRKPFRTADGFISIVPYSNGHWQRFLKVIGRADLADDGSITDPARRSVNVDGLYRLLAEVAPSRTTDEWLVLMRANDIPCAAVNRLDDLLEDSHLAAVGLFKCLDHPTEGRLRSVRAPFHVRDECSEGDAPAPRLGQHGRMILQEAGFSEAEIETALHSGAVQLPT